jgi:hypothetical protein
VHLAQTTTVPSKMNINNGQVEKHGLTGFAIDSRAVTVELGARVPTAFTEGSNFHPLGSSAGDATEVSSR